MPSTALRFGARVALVSEDDLGERGTVLPLLD